MAATATELKSAPLRKYSVRFGEISTEIDAHDFEVREGVLTFIAKENYHSRVIGAFMKWDFFIEMPPGS